MQAFNVQLFTFFGGGHAPNPALIWLASLLAENAAWPCVALMGWAAWRQPQQRAYVMATLIAAAAASLIAHGLADAIGMPRPFALGLSPAHIEHGARGSLPSTHATVMFAIGWIFCLRAPLRRFGLAIVAVAAVTGWARVYVGVHFPLDIVAGLVVAAVIAAAFSALRRLVNHALRRAGFFASLA